METFDVFPGKRSTQATSVVSETERLLSKLGHGYKKAKAQQILRLLKDQEALNQRFRDCALDDGDNEDDGAATDSDGQDSLAGNVGDDRPFANQRSTAPQKTNNIPRLVASKVDMSRCRTSMGFYNEAECSGSVDDNDREGISDFEAETDAAVLEEREAMLGHMPNENKFGQNRRLFRLQLDDAEVIHEESTIQSARSSRPKTGIVSSSAKSKQYRRPSQNDSSVRNNQNPTISTSVSKLENPITPRGNIRGFCDNLQDTRLQLTPRFNDMGGNFTPRVDEINQCFTPRAYDTGGHVRRLPNDIPAYLTPRQNDALTSLTPRQNETPRHAENNILTTPRPTNQHKPVFNYYSSQLTPRDDFAQYTPRYDDKAGMTTPRTYHGIKNGGIFETSSQSHNDPARAKRQGGTKKNATGARMPITPRSIITVDQSPIHVIPTACQDGEMTPRRQKNKQTSKKRADLQRTGAHQNLNKLSERVHPINVMKLPPLEVAINKPVIS